jgi:hypothetical protein
MKKLLLILLLSSTTLELPLLGAKETNKKSKRNKKGKAKNRKRGKSSGGNNNTVASVNLASTETTQNNNNEAEYIKILNDKINKLAEANTQIKQEEAKSLITELNKNTRDAIQKNKALSRDEQLIMIKKIINQKNLDTIFEHIAKNKIIEYSFLQANFNTKDQTDKNIITYNNALKNIINYYNSSIKNRQSKNNIEKKAKKEAIQLLKNTDDIKTFIVSLFKTHLSYEDGTDNSKLKANEQTYKKFIKIIQAIITNYETMRDDFSKSEYHRILKNLIITLENMIENKKYTANNIKEAIENIENNLKTIEDTLSKNKKDYDAKLFGYKRESYIRDLFNDEKAAKTKEEIEKDPAIKKYRADMKTASDKKNTPEKKKAAKKKKAQIEQLESQKKELEEKKLDLQKKENLLELL